MYFQILNIKNKQYIAEFLGTLLLVFFGTGSIIISEEYNGIIEAFGIGVTFGITVWLVVHFFSQFSDSHINPAVTIVMLFDKKISLKKSFGYISFQMFGALVASYSLLLLFPANKNLGNTFPRKHWEEAFVYEFFLSFILMLVILLSTSNKKLKRYAPLLIGFTVFFEAWLAGPVCGASMNPARTFGPAVVSGNMTHLWLYIVAPILGMLVAIFGYNFIKKKLVNATSLSNIIF